MDKLLRFLNAADINLLTTIPGITRPIAEGLVAARPFNSVEDCLKVDGVGKKLLARIQTTLEANEVEEEQYDMIPVEEEAMLPQVNRLVNETPEEKPSFGSRVGSAILAFLRALLRLILVVLLIGGVGAAIYFGFPILRASFIAPVEQNTARVTEHENEVADLKLQLTEISNRMDEMNTSIEVHTASLEILESMQLELETQLKENNNETLIKLKQEVMMTRVLDTLARARLYLSQSNFGLAKEDTQSARDLLAELETESSDEALTQAITRLDLALGNLPAFPVIASGDLEIAWQILMTGQATATATAQPTSAFTTTPEPTLEVTATATP